MAFKRTSLRSSDSPQMFLGCLGAFCFGFFGAGGGGGWGSPPRNVYKVEINGWEQSYLQLK